MPRLRAFAIAAASLLTVFCATRRSGATSKPDCVEATLLAPGSLPMPANAPALVLLSSSEAEDSHAELRNAEGTLLPLTRTTDPSVAGVELFALGGALSPGRHSLSFEPRCQNARREVSFDVGPVTPLPSSVGALVILEDRISDVWTPCNGTCPQMQTVTIGLAPSPDIRPWLELVDFEVRVDGELHGFASRSYGSRLNGEPVPSDGALTRVFQQCPRSGDATPSRYARGKHTVEVQAHVAGSPRENDPPPVTTEIEIRCGDSSEGSSACTMGRPVKTVDYSTLVVVGFVAAITLGARASRRRRASSRFASRSCGAGGR